MNFKIRFVGDRLLKDYAGMNYYAAKSMGFKPGMKKNVIYIDKNLKGKTKTNTIVHEICEANLMRNGMKYWTAHTRALKKEK
jgi:hypothetical protein